MKLVLRINKLIVVACFSLFTLLPACHPSGETVSTESFLPKYEVIQIVDRDGQTDKLKMKNIEEGDAETIQTSPRVTIKWLLSNNPSVKKITNIYLKTGSQNVFAPNNPHPIPGSLNWEGKIADHARGEERYNIDWVDQNDSPHTYDPKIQVK